MHIDDGNNGRSFEGSDSRDILWGNGGNDEIHGLSGNDEIFGGTGADRIWGDRGNDWLSGGDQNYNPDSSRDRFMYDWSENYSRDYIGQDTIYGFHKSLDKIEFKTGSIFRSGPDFDTNNDGWINTLDKSSVVGSVAGSLKLLLTPDGLNSILLPGVSAASGLVAADVEWWA